MTDLLSDVDTPSDAELISRVRGGDVAAYGELFSRHREAAQRLARQLVRGHDIDDLVAESFAKVLSVLQGGGGPDVAFRAYLLTAVRRLHVDRIRTVQRITTTDDLSAFDPGIPFQDTAVAGFESGAAAKAFASLPERWQLVLWHLEVEGQKPADIAPLLGMSANSVSALAYRAREGLRQAFLTMHLSEIAEDECRWVNEHLGAFVRKGLAKRDAAKVQAHLDDCRRCTAMYLELTEVNSNLAGIIAPLLLGGAATAYLAASGGAGAAGVLTVLSRAKDFAAANTGAVTAGAVATGVAAAAVATVVVAGIHHDQPDVTADPGAGITSTAPVPPSASGASTSPTGSTSPSASASAGSSASSTATGSPTAVSPSTVPTLTPAPSAGLLAVVPSGTAAPAEPGQPGPPGEPGQPDATQTAGDGGSDGASPSDTSSPTESAPGGNPAPTVDTPVVDAADGTVTVAVHNARAGDTLAVDLLSDSGETTFAQDGVPDSCSRASSTRVDCSPGVTSARAGRFSAPAATTSDFTATLPLTIGADLVDDDVTVDVSLDGTDTTATSGPVTITNPRTPTYDFSMADVSSTSHTVSGEDDRYDLLTHAVLPRRLHSLTFRTSDGEFRDGGPCTAAADDPSTVTCTGLSSGDAVTLPLVATGLQHDLDATVSVVPDPRFDDPTAGNNDAAPVTLEPGADLGLDLSVFSANPDRNARVELAGTLSGARDGMDRVRYAISGDATFAADRNPGCDLADDALSMTCPAAGQVDLVVLTGDRSEPTPVTVTAAPTAPFVAVGGSDDDAASVTLPDRPTHDFSFSGLHETGHTLSDDTDRYVLTGTVGSLPTDVHTVDLSVSGTGASLATDQADSACRVVTDDQGGEVLRCSGVDTDPTVQLTVVSDQHATHDVTVSVLPADPYDDPANDPTPDSDTVALSPASHLVLAPADLGQLHQDQHGDYPVHLRLSGVRPGLDVVRLEPGDGTSVTGTTTDGCAVDAGTLVCRGLADGADLDLTVTSGSPTRATALVLRAVPGGDFIDLYGDHTATASLVPAYDFSLDGLTQQGHTVNGSTDTYALRTHVGALPGDLDAVELRLTDGGSFAVYQPAGCKREASDLVRCTGLAAGGAVDLWVQSGSTAVHGATVRLVTPDGYDDPDATDDTASLTGLHPGVDLHLADLDPDNSSPANDDDSHQVRSHLSGVRTGLGSVTYTLSGAATFGGVSGPGTAGCTADGRTLTCEHPVDGDVTFTVLADDAHATTPITISVAPADPFVELNAADNADGVRLLPRPTYDFSLGALGATAHTVSGGTDHYTLSSDVSALPDGVDALVLSVTGGTFATDQDSGCSRTDTTHVRCGDLGSARRIGFHVDSTADAAHPVTIALQLPTSYVDPDPSDDSRTVQVSPGVDLGLGALTPADPTASGDGTYQVTTTLHGVRGPATLTVSGATVTATTCSRTDSTTVRCATPTEGQKVGLTLKPTQPRGVNHVTVTAAASGYEELDSSDNTASVTLAPDVTNDSLVLQSHSLDLQQVLVRTHVSDIPAGTTQLRIVLSGAGVGLGTGQVHFTDGALGADGDGPVNCDTTDASGKAVANSTTATCTNLSSDPDGSFYIDMRWTHKHGTPTPVTVTLVPVGVDENGRTANNSRTLTIS